MKKILKGIPFAYLLLVSAYTFSQPIPVELTAGHHYASINMVVSKNFTETSKFGIFHLNTIVMDYNDKDKNDFILQDLLTFEPIKNFRLTGGAFYGKPGFSPTAGLQYVKAGKSLFILISPRVNIESDPSYSFFSIVRYRPNITDNTKLYLGMQLLNIFDANNHIKSYQWFRTGLEVNATQFGLAVNLDEFGPNPKVAYNIGLFIRREIL